MEHIRQVEAGVIPRSTPVDFILSDWPLELRHARVWVGPSWPEVRAQMDAAEVHRRAKRAEQIAAGLISANSPDVFAPGQWTPGARTRAAWFPKDSDLPYTRTDSQSAQQLDGASMAPSTGNPIRPTQVSTMWTAWPSTPSRLKPG
jgi:hypothetical protein